MFFHFLCFPNRLREGRLFPAWKTVRNSLPKCSEAPLHPPVTWGAHSEGGLCVGGCPPSPAGTHCAFPLVPSSGPGPPQLTWPRANEGPGAPAHPGDGSSSPKVEKGEDRTEEGRGDTGGNRARREEEGLARTMGMASGVQWAQTPPGHTGRNQEPILEASMPAGTRRAATALGQEPLAPGAYTLCVDKRSRAKGWVCPPHTMVPMVSPRKWLWAKT